MKRFLKVSRLYARSPLGRSFVVGMALVLTPVWGVDVVRAQTAPRERISLNADWRFMKYASQEEADDLIYDVRPEVRDYRDDRAADAKPTEAVKVAVGQRVLKPCSCFRRNDVTPAKAGAAYGERFY